LPTFVNIRLAYFQTPGSSVPEGHNGVTEVAVRYGTNIYVFVDLLREKFKIFFTVYALKQVSSGLRKFFYWIPDRRLAPQLLDGLQNGQEVWLVVSMLANPGKNIRQKLKIRPQQIKICLHLQSFYYDTNFELEFFL
jgi:hypothetical protein